MQITFQIDEAFLQEIDLDFIKKALRTTFRLFHKNSEAVVANSVTLVITDNETIQQLNYQYRGIDAPTDVLSFENTPDLEFAHMDTDYLGDIIIAYPIAKVQALNAEHTPLAEVALLAIHGLLHLLGFDHDTPGSKQKMWAIQGQVMIELGLGHVHPTQA